jgi:3-oxoacyl-[acyl-carrier-protein] synthase II
MGTLGARRVVVTGLGMVSPLGLTVASTWEAILAGKSGIGQITRFDTTGLETTIAGELKSFEPTEYMDRKEVRRADRFAQMAVASASQALRDAGVAITPENAPKIGVAFGSGIGGVSTVVDNVLTHWKDPRKVSPFMIPMMIVDMAAGEIAMKFGAKGPNMGHVSACASSAHSIGEATETIKRGQADMMLAGGSEAGLIRIAIAAFNQARALSTRNDAPEKASRPFDRDRDGFVFSEAAGCLVLEELEHARARGAKIIAEVVGYGASADAYHVTAPAEGGEGAMRAMRYALEDARVSPTEVGYLNAHGTSTQANDVSETAAIKSVFGQHAYQLAVSSTKSMTGHTLGAAGAIEAIFSILAMRDGRLPPTINLDSPDPGCDLDYVPKVARRKAVDLAMSNSMGFGGHNASLLLRNGASL